MRTFVLVIVTFFATFAQANFAERKLDLGPEIMLELKQLEIVAITWDLMMLRHDLNETQVVIRKLPEKSTARHTLQLMCESMKEKVARSEAQLAELRKRTAKAQEDIASGMDTDEILAQLEADLETILGPKSTSSQDF